MPYWIYKRTNKEYVPTWMYIVGALLSLLEGSLDLILVPFGYKCDIVTLWNEYILLHMMDIYEKKELVRNIINFKL